MSRCSERLKPVRAIILYLLAFLLAYICAPAAGAREKPAQSRSTWVLHKPHSDLADGYDPRRDAEKDLAVAGDEAQKSDKSIPVSIPQDSRISTHLHSGS